MNLQVIFKKEVKVTMDNLKPLIWAILITAIISTMDWTSYLSE